MLLSLIPIPRYQYFEEREKSSAVMNLFSLPMTAPPLSETIHEETIERSYAVILFSKD